MGLFKKKKKTETVDVPIEPRIANYSGFGAIIVEDGVVDPTFVPKKKKKPLLEPFVKDGVKYVPVVYYVPEEDLHQVEEEQHDEVKPVFDSELSDKVCAATKTNHRFTLHKKSKDGKVWFFLDEDKRIYPVPADKL